MIETQRDKARRISEAIARDCFPIEGHHRETWDDAIRAASEFLRRWDDGDTRRSAAVLELLTTRHGPCR